MSDAESLTLDDLPEPTYQGAVPVDDLEVDGDNPNEMDDQTYDLLVDRIQTRGWVGNAIVTDTDGLIADGEHRWRAAKELRLDVVPVKQYDLSDGERRLLRQELNKIRGRHELERDAMEYDRILEEAESVDDIGELAKAIATDEDDIRNTLEEFQPDPVGDFPDSFADVGEQDTEHECPNCGYMW